MDEMAEQKKGGSTGRHARTKPAKPAKKLSWGRLIKWGFILVVMAAVFGMAGYMWILFNGDRMLKENLAKLEVPEASIVYDANNEEIYRFYRENRDLATQEELPELLVQAFIAKEDQRFYEHEGIDIWSIGRAVVTDIMAGSFVQGGSTITQQLAKNLFLNADKTIMRKATEASMAVALENRFEKDEIILQYLNTIFFGQRAHGVKSAALTYFGKESLNELELWEMATLAAIPKAPSVYNPITDPEKSKQQRQVVLKLMQEQGYITEEQRSAAAEVDYVQPTQSQDKSGYQAFIDYVLSEVEEKAGITEDRLLVEGYKIYTTLNQQAQQAVHVTMSKSDWYTDDKDDQMVESGMVIMDHQTGAIQAMYGGRQYTVRSTNRATEKHQPGSAFKPIVSFAPALESGNWNPYSMLVDEKMSFGSYSPSNYDFKYEGEVTMIDAVTVSKNIPAVWLLNEIGIDEGLQFAKDVGIEMAAEDRNLAIALGGLTYGASPLEMAEAYTPFANQGNWTEGFALVKVENASGNALYEHQTVTREVMSAQNAYYMTEMLESVVQSGTGRAARMDRGVAGKTGTTQVGLDSVKDPSANRDAWFVGYTTEWTAAIWMGFPRTDENHYLKAKSGTPAAMFAESMTAALQGREATWFSKPQGVKDMPKPPQAVTDVATMYEDIERAVYVTWSTVGEGYEYHLYRKAADEEEFKRLNTSTEDLVRDLSVEYGKTYEYYVVAVDPSSGLQSDPSNRSTIDIPTEEDYEDPLDSILDPDGEEGEEEGTDGDASEDEGEGSGDSGDSGDGDPNTDPGSGDGTADNPGDDGNTDEGNEGSNSGDGGGTPDDSGDTEQPTGEADGGGTDGQTGILGL